jgi:uroporphyrinogen-III synthase
MLKGKVIINTRQKDADDLISGTLENLGATVLSMPLIKIHPLEISPHIQADVSNSTYQWLVFTSKNGVDHFFDQFKADFKPTTLPFKTAVFGKKTDMALKENGLSADVVSQGNVAEDLLNELIPLLRPEDKVLLVLGNLAAPLLQERLTPVVNVERIDVYHTSFVTSINAKILQAIIEDKYDLILFTSPSGFKSFKHHTEQIVDFGKLKIACIGPTTEDTLIASGIRPLVVANPSGKRGLIKGIEDFFATQPSEKIKVK